MSALLKSATIALVCALLLPVTGCSSMSKSARAQRSYQKYVRKMSGARDKQRARYSERQQQMFSKQEPSEPVETISTGPQSASSNPSGE